MLKTVIPLVLFSTLASADNCGCDLSGKQSTDVSTGTLATRPQILNPQPRPIDSIKPQLIVRQPIPGILEQVSVEERLKGCTILRDAIFWQEADGRQVSYEQWSDARKQRFDELFQSLMRGDQDLGLQCPDPARALYSNDQAYLSASEAFDVYAAHAAHVLYLEATRKVPWSVSCLPLGELVQLLASDRYQQIIVGPTSNSYPSHIQSGRDYQAPFYAINAPMLSCDPREGFRFMTGALSHQQENLLGSDAEDTLANLSLFFLNHWVHAAVDDIPGSSSEWQQKALLSDRLKPTGQQVRTGYGGCHGSAGTFYELARSVNISLIDVSTQESSLTIGHFSNRTHAGLLYGWSSAQPRILWHIDNLYAVKAGPFFPVDAHSTALDSADAKRLYFERLWPSVDRIQAWGFVYNLHRVYPGIGFGINDRRHLEDYPDFGSMGGYWLSSDRAEQLLAQPPSTLAEWNQYWKYTGDLVARQELENYYQLGAWELVKYACEPKDGRLWLDSFVDAHQRGERTGLTTPVTRTKDDYWNRAQAAVAAYGGCNAVDSAFQLWELGRL